MDDKELKVTDKRMFTADGELREGFRHLDRDRDAGAAEPAPPAAKPEAPAATRASAVPEAPAAPESDAGPAAPRAAPAPQAAPEPQAASAPPAAGGSPGAAADAGEPPEGAPRLEIPGTPEGLGAPTFLDLVTLLAEPIALYMGDVEMPDGESMENLDMARLHIDLLDVLRQKTAGNLEAGEARLLEDLLYRCRLRYVQKRG